MRLTRNIARLAAVALAAGAFTVAQAQTTGTIVGTIQDASNGNPISGALVVAQSPSLQGEQTALTSDEGTFRITLLPPGQYTIVVQADSYRPGQRGNITVDIDKTIRVTIQLVPKALKAKDVVVKATAPVIDQGSTSSGAVVNADTFAKNIPSGRSFQSVLNVAPSASSDGLGTTFRGSSSPENDWIIDGVTTTDVAYGNGGTSLPSYFVKQVEVKTGGYQAEYGQATGGVVNVVTRSGGNEFHGDAFVRFSSAALNLPTKDIQTGPSPIKPSAQQSLNVDFGFDLGGYIIKDKLWFFVGVVPQRVTETYTRHVWPMKNDANGTSFLDPNWQPNFGNPISSLTKTYDWNATTIGRMAKLTWNVNENNSAQVSYFGDPGSDSGIVDSSLNGSQSFLSAKESGGNQDLTVRWTSKLFNKKMLAEVWYGLHYETNNSLPDLSALKPGEGTSVSADIPAGTQIATEYYYPYLPADFATTPGCEPTTANDPTTSPCASLYYGVGPHWYQQENTMTRNAVDLKFTNFVNAAGHHTIKYGGDYQDNRFLNKYGYYNKWAQNIYPSYTRTQGLGSVNSAGYFVPKDFRRPDGHTYDTSLFLQDSYSPVDGLSIDLGLRWATQQVWGTGEKKASISINDNLAPRVGVTYDWTGTGRSKVSAYYGRFYEAIPMDINSRAFGGEVFGLQWWAPDGTNITGPHLSGGFWPTHGCPQPYCDKSGDTYLLGGSGEIVAPGLKGQYIDEYSAGVQYEILPDLAVGATLVHRNLGNIIEDVSPDNGNTYIIANPGNTGAINAGVATLTKQLQAAGGTLDSSQMPDCSNAKDPATCNTIGNNLVLVRGIKAFPAPVRNYDAIELSVKKNFSRNWYMIASLTFSKTYGNYPGLFTPENGQLDPNITSQYDLVSLLYNRMGPLRTDHPVYFKLDGYYLWNFGLVTGLSLRGRSGTPIDVLGAHPLYGPNEAFVLPRGTGGRTPPIYDVDVNVGYQLKVTGDVKVALNANIFNLFNFQQLTDVSSTYTDNSMMPVVGGKLSDIQDKNGTPTVLDVYGDLITKSPNWRKPVASSQVQTPLGARIDLRVSF